MRDVLDPPVSVFSLSLYRHPFLYTLFNSRFTLIINNKLFFCVLTSFITPTLIHILSLVFTLLIHIKHRLTRTETGRKLDLKLRVSLKKIGDSTLVISHTIWTGMLSVCTTKIEFPKYIWNWVVEEHMKDDEKESKELSIEQVEVTTRCVWLLDSWWETESCFSLYNNNIVLSSYVCIVGLWICRRSSGILWSNCPTDSWSWCLSLLFQNRDQVNDTHLYKSLKDCTSRYPKTGQVGRIHT
jgi:hypothetical protein